MSSSRNVLVAVLLGLAALTAPAADRFPGIGRDATAKEVAAWDIDVRPDFKGLPKGSGSVAKGQEVWESKCASCHGVFGEATNVFNPIVGGTTADDIKTGHVASLRTGSFPGRTTLMKVAYVSSLWDYINRAMPWSNPKTLSVEEVYAATAYLLNLGGIVPDNFVLSDQNIGEAQARMPNRNGLTTAHAMWPGRELGGTVVPDVRATACMKDCPGATRVTSFIPAFARNAHGNLADQNRPVGAQHGVDTAEPASQGAIAKPTAAAAGDNKAAVALTQKYGCTGCHAMQSKLVGPSFAEIAKKHEGKADYLAGKIKSGGSGVWGPIPMPPQALSADEAKTLGNWLAAGAGK